MERWLAVLERFLEKDEWGVRELSQTVGLPRSVVHRVLRESERQGLLRFEVTSRKYTMGPTLIRLAVLALNRVQVARVARPILERTAAQCDETVILTVYDRKRHRLHAVDAVESTHVVRYMWESLMDWSELHVGASGKGILAFLNEEERSDILSRLPDPVPGPEQLSKGDLVKQLDEARAKGYVVSGRGRVAGVMGAAAPIFDAQGIVLGDLIVAWPEARNANGRAAELGELAGEAAAEISKSLGYRTSGHSG